MNASQTEPSDARSDFVASEHTMTLPDGTALFYRAWLPDAPTHKSLVIFHRGHEHSGRVQDIVEALDLHDTAIFAWDARGHGRTPGERGYAPSFATVVNDVECFVRHLCQTYEKRPEDMVVLAQSVGAVTVATWVHDYAPRIRAMILAAPALEIKLYVPLAIPGLRLLLKFRKDRKTFIKSYVKATMLTHDRQQAQRYDEDGLIAREIAANVLVDLHDASARLVDDAGAIRVPTLLLAAGADWVVKLGPQRRLFERLGTPLKRMKVFAGMYHDLLHEKDRHLVIDEARQFIGEAFQRDAAPAPLLEADRYGFTRNEFDRLSEPLPWHSSKGLAFRLQRLGMTTLGRLSRGVRLGLRTGFDSGKTLDYVYENRPDGALLLGKWIDRSYLDSIGWRGIRQRRVNLEKLLQEAIRLLRAEGQPIRLVDIAAGPGRYILETLRNLAGTDLSALLRDNVGANLEAGRKLAGEMGLSNVTFQLGDAFDQASLAAIQPPPNVAVVSGLYELFGDNGPVRRSLRGLAEAVSPGGYLVYTGQPWHPQVEMIARVLTNREGRPWIMRRRTQEEMDDLVREAGFQKKAEEIDPWGIFTVSLARRAAALILPACAASVLLSILFLAVYSGTNWLTSQRSDVGTWYYAWERYIPFVPLMVIPYMSIDTYQHHVVDVAGGFLLAAVAFYLVPAIACQHAVTPNRRIGSYYLLASVAASLMAVLLWPWGSILLWPAAACLVATAAYFGLGPGIYRKIDGRLTLSTRILLAPLLAGQKLSLRYYRRQCRAWDEVTPRVWLGRVLSDREAVDALRKGVTAVLDVTAEFSEALPLLATCYLNVPILDLTAPTPEQLRRCLAFVSENAARGVVYVHCKIGYSRSAVVAGAYLMESGAVSSADEAIARLRAVRPSLVVRPEAVAALHRFDVVPDRG